jgi:AraC family transcriptional regulator
MISPIHDFLMRLFVHKIEGTEPRIVQLDEPIQALGMSTYTDSRQASRDVAALGRRYQEFKIQNQIPHRKQPWAFVGVSKDFNEMERSFWYMMGDVVTHVDQVPKGLEAFQVPAGTYAVFPVRPKNRLGWGPAIVNAKRYAFLTWLPNSEYQAAGTIDDFEYHDERSTRPKDPEIDLYVAIRPR